MWKCRRTVKSIHLPIDTGLSSIEHCGRCVACRIQAGAWKQYVETEMYMIMMADGNLDPTTQADFSDQVVANTTDVDPGHQCYKLDALENVSAGQNGTIQLEYWAEFEGENDGKNQSFFACADVVRCFHQKLLLVMNANTATRPLWRRVTSPPPFHASMLLPMSSLHRRPQVPTFPQTLVSLPRRQRVAVEVAAACQPVRKQVLPSVLSLQVSHCLVRWGSSSGGEEEMQACRARISMS